MWCGVAWCGAVTSAAIYIFGGGGVESGFWAKYLWSLVVDLHTYAENALYVR